MSGKKRGLSAKAWFYGQPGFHASQPPSVLDRIGERITLEYEGYWTIRRTDERGGRTGSGFGQDEAGARAKWAEMKAAPPCLECGDPPLGNWQESCAKQMTERQLCFFCNHWTNVIAGLTPDHAIIDGCVYRIGEDELSIARRCGWRVFGGRLDGEYRHVLGHGGAEFEIEYFDGRRRKTTNLWHGGEIPKHFIGRLPNTARFVK